MADSSPTIQVDIIDVIDEHERAVLIAELRRRGFVDDAEDWLGLA